jgi:hypothetical protein
MTTNNNNNKINKNRITIVKIVLSNKKTKVSWTRFCNTSVEVNFKSLNHTPAAAKPCRPACDGVVIICG